MTRPQYAGKSILEKLWESLDTQYAIATDLHNNGTDATRELGVCRGLAIAIYEMSIPQFSSVDDVATYAAKRYEGHDG